MTIGMNVTITWTTEPGSCNFISSKDISISRFKKVGQVKSRFRSQKSTDAPTTFFAPASVAWLFGGGGGDDDDDDGDGGKEATEGFVVDAVLVRHDLDGGGLQFVVDPQPMRISPRTDK